MNMKHKVMSEIKACINRGVDYYSKEYGLDWINESFGSLKAFKQYYFQGYFNNFCHVLPSAADKLIDNRFFPEGPLYAFGDLESDFGKSKSVDEFVSDVAKALEDCNIDPVFVRDNCASALQKGGFNFYKTIRPAYIKLREQGYEDGDLTP